MKQFANLLKDDSDFQALLESVKNRNLPACVTGLSQIHKAHWVYSACLGLERTALVITPDEASATKLCEDLNGLFNAGRENSVQRALQYPQRELVLRDVESTSREYEHKRLSVLGKILNRECDVVVASVSAAAQFTLPPQVYRDRTLLINSDGSYDIGVLAAQLVAAGYVRREQVDGTCQFSIRGGILDLFPPDSPFPVRIEFWGDEIDTMAYFDLDTQRRTENISSVRVSPAQETLFESPEQLAGKIEDLAAGLSGKAVAETAAKLRADAARLREGAGLRCYDRFLPLLYPEPATLFDYMTDGLLFVSEYTAVKEVSKSDTRQLAEDVRILFEDHLLCRGLDRFALDFQELIDRLELQDCILLETFAKSVADLRLKNLINASALQLSAWSGEYRLLEEDLRGLLTRRYCIAVLAGTQKSAAALMSDLQKSGFSCELSKDIKAVIPGKIIVLPGELSAGFEYPQLHFACITHSRMGAQRQGSVRRKKMKDAQRIQSISDLAPGDHVVHSAHGIGVFEGIQQLDLQGIIKDYIKIRYAGTDVLYVPVTQLDLVSKYIGPGEDQAVKLNRLNSAQWQQTKARVKRAVKDMAKELIALYAKRLNRKGYAFPPDNDWQQQFEERFPYEETEDQLRCVEEIKQDMQRPVPMDRLLCGDVGFGKTEVALRAAFKCVLESKQCAILVPTTILAWQHYQTLLKRMDGFPVNIELLSRFRTPKQQEAIIRKLRTGEVDIVVGTHRIVQKDIKFRDLGLLIIDEEQRFGVAHKEKLKELKNDIDVLTLSATPIPRTLNMAMSGIRDMSVIEQAPNDRHPVQTYVMEHDDGVIADAIRRELRRGGQVFYLHNHVDTVDRCAARIARLIPDARISFAHGRMGEEELSEIWRKLIDHEIDILVCTTIIETGVDVPNCNTLIIEDADKMGLSQLYQLRGRVGRSSRRAHAYFTFRRGKVLTEIATKRLSAIRDFTQFGSGFRIAMRDLEIRGAGSILGGQQHGHMETVGYEMYVRLLSEAIAEEKGETLPDQNNECLIDIRINAHIPERYISNTNQRIEVYRRIAGIRSEEDALDVTDELIDRFGDPPKSVHGLIDVALLRNMAAAQGIVEITQRDNMVLFYPQSLNMERAARLVGEIKGRAVVNASEKPYIGVRLLKGDDPLEIMRESLKCMNG